MKGSLQVRDMGNILIQQNPSPKSPCHAQSVRGKGTGILLFGYPR
jgi:hypothetical protein